MPMNDTKNRGAFVHLPENPSLFQPFAIALACALFICLFLAMGFVNLRTLDRAFSVIIKGKGQALIKNLERAAGLYYNRIDHSGSSSNVDMDLLAADDVSTYQDSFLLDLIAVATDMDMKTDSGISPQKFSDMAADQGLYLVAILDDKGNIRKKNINVPDDVLEKVAPVIHGRRSSMLDLLGTSKSQSDIRVIALRRQSGTGTIVIGLDRDSFDFRTLKFSLMQAVNDVEWDKDTSYIQVHDLKNRNLLTRGVDSDASTKIPEGTKTSKGGFQSDADGFYSSGSYLLEVSQPFTVNHIQVGVIRLGLTSRLSGQIIRENRKIIFVSTGFMMLIALLSMVLLHKNQKKHFDYTKEAERRFQQAQRLSALGRMGAGVAHEIRNPLNAISIAVQRLHRQSPGKLTELIREEIKRLNIIIEDFLTISKSRTLTLKQTNLTELIEQIFFLLKDPAASRDIVFKANENAEPILVCIDPDKIKQALLNLFINAIDAINDGGVISVDIESFDSQWVKITVSDTGVGIEEKHIKQIFDYDYTTKEKGLGLGLPIAHEIIAGHGGRLSVKSRIGKGTRFIVELPMKGRAD